MAISNKSWGYLAPLVAFAASIGLVATGQENVTPEGIFALNDSVVLFTKVLSCNNQSDLPAAQIFVSADGGATWAKRGPGLEGSEFEYAYERDGKLWIAGEHTAEGPSSDQFILVPGETSSEWIIHTIYEGPSELKGIAFHENGELVAWIRHINVHKEDWPGATYIHKSYDGGRTWKTLGRLKTRSNQPGQWFLKIGMQASTWQIVDQGQSGVLIQHQRKEKANWETVSRFPLIPCQN
jgi:hypothetical protein